MTAAYPVATQADVLSLADDYDAIVRRFANDHGELPHAHAVDAAQIAHRLAEIHEEQAEHWRRLSREHREGRTQR
ncbi:hypothetical protein [Lentzea albida]|uniref:Uncharacterized protein n=1 Tax=Lentzea albida TaxID=65499 RepID=A0A1H9UAN8_9PSEU|nr:hypothetical protein [Lentzea albida]SES06610.1 hypothetical protein SAMN04488000_115149 [Lentzea albida]